MKPGELEHQVRQTSGYFFPTPYEESTRNYVEVFKRAKAQRIKNLEHELECAKELDFKSFSKHKNAPIYFKDAEQSDEADFETAATLGQ